ncbi:glutathione peroxidase family protein [alpha proteobacterium U9-1i]|nr:glutathione peroxidase family protein [alpha proteobacterium U9-1i]
MTSVYDFTARDIDGRERSLSEFRGKVLLIVNTASQCGFTYQYEGLEALHRKYADKGVEVLGFPCNQFKHQEPGDAEEIKSFCSLTYDVTFPMFAKIDVKGAGAHPLYRHLTSARKNFLGRRSIEWNFTKFLIDREGKVRARFSPLAKPEALQSRIERLI